MSCVTEFTISPRQSAVLDESRIGDIDQSISAGLSLRAPAALPVG